MFMWKAAKDAFVSINKQAVELLSDYFTSSIHLSFNSFASEHLTSTFLFTILHVRVCFSDISLIKAFGAQ